MVSKNNFNGNEQESKIERVKNLIFGAQINQYEQKFEEIFSKLDGLEKSFAEKLFALENKTDERIKFLEDKINSLSASTLNDSKELQNNLDNIKEGLKKDIQQLKNKTVDKSKIANFLKNLTEE